MCKTFIRMGDRGLEITSMGIDRFWEVEVISEDMIIVNGRRCVASQQHNLGCGSCYLQGAPGDICAHVACHSTERADGNNITYQLEDGG